MTNPDDTGFLKLPEEDDENERLIRTADIHRYLPIDIDIMLDLGEFSGLPPHMTMADGFMVHRVDDIRRWLFKLIYPDAPLPGSHGKGDRS